MPVRPLGHINNYSIKIAVEPKDKLKLNKLVL